MAEKENDEKYIVEKLEATYANADNKDVTFTYGIKRIKTNVAIKNVTGGGNTTGHEPTNEDKEKFGKLQKSFMKEVSYDSSHGVIYGIEGDNNWRIDQQNNHQDGLYNIQYQVAHKTFANVVLNTKIEPVNTSIHMDMQVFAKNQGMEKIKSHTVKTVGDVNKLDDYREETSKIKLSEKINKYVGEALHDSLHEKLKYEIKIILLKQKIG